MTLGLLPNFVNTAALRYFYEVARYGSFRLAADRIHIAASAISRQIQLLEQELGVKLFARDRKGLRLTAAGEDWHSDVSCDPEPPMGSILYLMEVPSDGGGDTMFANMYRAYEMLSEPIRKLIDGLAAIHDGEKHYRGRYGNDDRGKTYPRAEHPIVRTHPETGRKCLFVNRFFTTRIVGLHRSESDAVLEMLYRHIETPELSVRFKWQPNSIAFWDNRCTQHKAIWDYYPNVRSGYRIQIKGSAPPSPA